MKKLIQCRINNYGRPTRIIFETIDLPGKNLLSAEIAATEKELQEKLDSGKNVSVDMMLRDAQNKIGFAFSKIRKSVNAKNGSPEAADLAKFEAVLLKMENEAMVQIGKIAKEHEGEKAEKLAFDTVGVIFKANEHKWNVAKVHIDANNKPIIPISTKITNDKELTTAITNLAASRENYAKLREFQTLINGDFAKINALPKTIDNPVIQAGISKISAIKASMATAMRNATKAYNDNVNAMRTSLPQTLASAISIRETLKKKFNELESKKVKGEKLNQAKREWLNQSGLVTKIETFKRSVDSTTSVDVGQI